MRVFRLIATPILLLGLLGFLIWGGLWGWRNLTAPLPSPEPTPCVLLDQEGVWPNDVLINVYNGGYTRGLAERVATQLRDSGYHIARTTNTEETVRVTIIRGAESDQRSLDLVASNFVDSTIDYDERVDGTVDVLVGTEFGGYTEEPLTHIPLEGDQVCKPMELYAATASPEPEGTEDSTEDAGEDSEEEESSEDE